MKKVLALSSCLLQNSWWYLSDGKVVLSQGVDDLGVHSGDDRGNDWIREKFQDLVFKQDIPKLKELKRVAIINDNVHELIEIIIGVADLLTSNEIRSRLAIIPGLSK
ncbi:MAG: hypothetical protein KKD01_12040 [Proteobacteria bacterium]|nr:hypothetical protein [Pseudomonadota bacterium]MBU1138716.1 hypothetical protein [Pseudomonadota bacterium]MBU1231795.1 hypothetical protein [Pseudomonadota bacterium]MBU1418786.1 hypothetical protein [Pseudomonadota bacterium]MBU1455450.1 hypothetical protein [Pseudomonadota bacterium]